MRRSRMEWCSDPYLRHRRVPQVNSARNPGVRRPSGSLRNAPLREAECAPFMIPECSGHRERAILAPGPSPQRSRDLGCPSPPPARGTFGPPLWVDVKQRLQRCQPRFRLTLSLLGRFTCRPQLCHFGAKRLVVCPQRYGARLQSLNCEKCNTLRIHRGNDPIVRSKAE